MSSIRSKADPSSNNIANTTETPEESSWTMYFEDFLQHHQNNNINDHYNNYTSTTTATTISTFSSGSSSLISDANSSAAKKLADNEEKISALSSSKSRCHIDFNRLSFKKRKLMKETSTNLLDDALEDTATSPVSSPKICNLSHELNVKPQERNNLVFSQERGSNSGYRDERYSGHDQLGLLDKEIECTTDLKKKGLCLVPLSMLANYLA